MMLAYIDPGSGSILLQVIFAAAFGTVAMYWKRLKAFFTRGKKTEASAAKQSPTTPE